MNPQVTSALIAASVSFLGVVAAITSARWTIASARAKIMADTLALQQNLLKDVLAKRMVAYAAVWKVLVTYHLNWKLEDKQFDRGWSLEFLRQVNACNAEHGVFFSQSVYERFDEFHTLLTDITQRSKQNEEISQHDRDGLDKLLFGTPDRSGLGTVLKDDLGSYIEINLRLGATPPRV